MKQFLPLAVILLLTACSGNSEPEDLARENEIPRLEFRNFEEKISYCIGLDHASDVYGAYGDPRTKMNFDMEQIEIGMIDYLIGNELRIPFEACDSIFDAYLLPDGMVDETAVPKVDASYAIGMQEGYVLVGSLVGRGIDQSVYVDLLTEGIKDGLRNVKPSVTLPEARKEVADYYSELNKESGATFLANNAQKDSIMVTESGLQYKVYKKGTGLAPNLTDSCIVHYTGRLLDGREFDSTIPSQRPLQVSLLEVIPGWQEGLQLMQEGGQYRFFIPYHLAYGEAGSGPIEPFSALVYDIELLKVKRFQ